LRKSEPANQKAPTVALLDVFASVMVPCCREENYGYLAPDFSPFSGRRSRAPRRPLLILNNGSDGSLLDMWLWGGAGATSRGYDCLTFGGPGQGYALWKQKLYFRPDREKVITPVVDFALSRPDVDPKRIAIQGISQGGYWVPRAVAFEKRIAAAVADPGVVDVATSWTEKIQCSLMITSPVNEAYWPGQSRRLYEMVNCPQNLVEFTEADGADLHCEPKGTGIRDLRVFNWLDQTLSFHG
jgi:hypothetical protein